MRERLLSTPITKRNLLAVGGAVATATLAACGSSGPDTSAGDSAAATAVAENERNRVRVLETVVAAVNQKADRLEGRVGTLEQPTPIPQKIAGRPPYTPLERAEMTERVTSVGQIITEALQQDVVRNFSPFTPNAGTARLARTVDVAERGFPFGAGKTASDMYDDTIGASLGEQIHINGGVAVSYSNFELRFTNPFLGEFYRHGSTDQTIVVEVLNPRISDGTLNVGMDNPDVINSSTLRFKPTKGIKQVIDKDDLLPVAQALFNVPEDATVEYTTTEIGIEYGTAARRATIRGYNARGQEVTITMDSFGNGSYSINPN